MLGLRPLAAEPDNGLEHQMIGAGPLVSHSNQYNSQFVSSTLDIVPQSNGPVVLGTPVSGEIEEFDPMALVGAYVAGDVHMSMNVQSNFTKNEDNSTANTLIQKDQRTIVHNIVGMDPALHVAAIQAHEQSACDREQRAASSTAALITTEAEKLHSEKLARQTAEFMKRGSETARKHDADLQALRNQSSAELQRQTDNFTALV
jgi:hypothetical protein